MGLITPEKEEREEAFTAGFNQAKEILELAFELHERGYNPFDILQDKIIEIDKLSSTTGK